MFKQKQALMVLYACVQREKYLVCVIQNESSPFLHLFSWHAVNVAAVPACVWCGPAYNSSVKVIAVYPCSLCVYRHFVCLILQTLQSNETILQTVCLLMWLRVNRCLLRLIKPPHPLLHIRHIILAAQTHRKYMLQPIFLQNAKYIAQGTFCCTFQIH